MYTYEVKQLAMYVAVQHEHVHAQQGFLSEARTEQLPPRYDRV